MFQRIIRSVFFEPWHLLPSAHYSIQKIVLARLNGVKSGDLLDEFTSPALEYSVADGVALVPLSGVMGRKLSMIEKKCGGVDTLDVSKMLDAALADPAVVAAVVVADTPGGSHMGTQELANKVAAFVEEKPLVTFVDGTLASAGVYALAASSQIYAGDSSEVGSIGTYLALLDESQAFADEGLKVELFTSGKYKGAGVPGLPLSEEQKAYFQTMVDEANQKFQAWVQHYRPSVPLDAMQGQMFWSDKAKAIGLVDAVASLDDAINDAKSLASM